MPLDFIRAILPESCLPQMTKGDNVRDEKKSASSREAIASCYSLQSLVVTHLTTNLPIRCLNRAERTGSLVVSWSFTTKVPKSTVSRNGGAGIG